MIRESDIHRPQTLLLLLRRRWGLIALFTALATVTAAVLVSPAFKPDEYESRVVMVVPSLRNAKTLTFLKSDFAGYGIANEKELRQVLAALESEDAFRYMVAKFNLVEHYGLGGLTDPHQREKHLRGYYGDRVRTETVRRATIRVTVYDHDRQMASRIANEFIVYADSFLNNVSKREKSLQELEQSIYAMRLVRSVQEDSIALLLRDRLQMYNFDYLGEVMSEQVAQELLRNRDFAASYDRLQSSEQRVKFLEAHLAAMTSEYNYRRENLRVFPSLINTASVGLTSEMPARPNRPLYVGLSAVAALLAAIALVWFVDGLIYPRQQTYRIFSVNLVAASDEPPVSD